MAPHQDDIAAKLLQSSDARIAEAAKRVFSSTLPIVSTNLTSATPLAVHSSASAFNDHSIYTETTSGAVDQMEYNNIHPNQALHATAEYQHTTNINSTTTNSTASNDDVQDDEDGEKKPSSTERLKRSRERNRMHARKTRQRKKEHMQKLQTRADELKLEQIRIKQAINEKNTANILVGLFQNNDGAENADNVDPKVEVLLKRSTEDIPDAQKIPELPALILPGQHNGKRKSTGSVESDCDKEVPEELQEDGIDYKLLGKDRSACTPAELDQIRRERNRMHAKRTRDRKRIFMELMEVMIKQLEDENALLLAHANKLNVYVPPPTEGENNDDMMFPAQPITPPLAPMSSPANPLLSATQTSETQTTKGDFLNQIESLLAAGSAFRKREMCEINAISCAESDVTASTNHSDQHNSFGEEEECYPNKRQCMSSDFPTSVPKSITTTNYSL